MDTDFKNKVRSLKVTELRAAFPGEAQCHRDMLDRCRDGSATVSDKFKSFKDFLLELGPRPNRLWTLDRINPADPEYAPDKVRWADKRQQANNRTTTIFLSVDGIIKPLTDWARQTRQKPNTIRQRLNRGYTHEDAVYPERRNGRSINAPGLSADLKQPANWPDLLDATKFEKSYSLWAAALKRNPGLTATREVFAAWISGNRTKYLRSGLRERYPTDFGAEAFEEDTLAAIINDDPLYQDYMKYHELADSLLKGLTPNERNFHFRVLKKHHIFGA